MRASEDPKVVAGADKLERLFRGLRFHLRVRDVLREWFPEDGWTYRSGGKGNEGPDFFQKKNSRDIELTTRGEYQGHKSRGGLYDGCRYAFYTMPKK